MTPGARGERVDDRTSGARIAAVILWAAAAAACGARLPKLPAAGGPPAADMAAVALQARSACNAVNSMSAEISVSGSIGGHRLRARLLGGFTAPSVRLEAVAPAGPPFFIFVANGEDATLLLPRDNAVLRRGRSDDVLEAIAGVRLGPSELLRTLTGCAEPGRWSGGVAAGEHWRIASGEHGGKMYFHRDSASAPWHIATLLYPGAELQWSWRADYNDFRQGLPSSIHLVSADRHGFDLEVKLSQVDVGAPLGGDVFRVQIPRDAQPITIDELRRSGVFGRKSDGG